MALPSGYTRHQYIQSSGTQYIDTEFVPTANTRIIMDFQLTRTDARCYLLGVNGDFSFQWRGSDSPIFRWSGSMVNDFQEGILGAVRHIVEKNGTKCTIDGAISAYVQDSSLVTMSLYLLACHFDSYANYFASAKLFSCKIYEGRKLVRDFIPCKNAAGTVGLWDDANGKFYTNAGTGTFIAGEVVVPDSSQKTFVNGTEYNINSGRSLVAGTGYTINKGRTLINGTGYNIFIGKRLSEYTERDIVYIHENGVPVEFYVAKHDYESGLNGAGRTLLVRKELHTRVIFNDLGYYVYLNSYLDNWLNNTYKPTLSPKVQDAIGTTTFYYTSATNQGLSSDVVTGSRSVFTLSVTEFNGYDPTPDPTYPMFGKVEGSPLPIADMLRFAKVDGEYVRQWTRTKAQGSGEYSGEAFRAFYIESVVNHFAAASDWMNTLTYCRPVFTLPEDTVFNTNTNEIML